MEGSNLKQSPGVKSLCYVYMQVTDSDYVNQIASMRSCPKSQAAIAITDDGDILKVNLDIEKEQNLAYLGHGLDEGCESLSRYYKSEHNNDEMISFMKRIIKSFESKNKDGANDGALLLGHGLLWLLADIYGISELHEEMLHEKAHRFGYRGKKQILEYKAKLLSTYVINYNIDVIHQLDVPNRVIVADFECYLKGKEGRGTYVTKFDADSWKVIEVQTIRHNCINADSMSLTWDQHNRSANNERNQDEADAEK